MSLAFVCVYVLLHACAYLDAIFFFNSDIIGVNWLIKEKEQRLFPGNVQLYVGNFNW